MLSGLLRYLRSCALGAALVAAVAAQAGGDPIVGKQLHDERCLFCHGVENYEGSRSKIKSLKQLREMVRRWEDKLRDPFTELEREDVVAYLNLSFYKFSEQREARR